MAGKFSRTVCAVLLLMVAPMVYAIPLWPVTPGSQWFYEVTLSDGTKMVESFNFTGLVERNSIQYVVDDDGFAINSNDNAIFGFEDIFTDPDGEMFSLIVDSTTPTLSVTTGLGTYDAFLFQTIEPDYRVDNYIVPGFGLFYIEEGPINMGVFEIEERVELIRFQVVPVPAAWYLFGSAMVWLGFRRKRKFASR